MQPPSSFLHVECMIRAMDPTRRFFARLMLELHLRRAKGRAFEEIFKAVMQRAAP